MSLSANRQPRSRVPPLARECWRPLLRQLSARRGFPDERVLAAWGDIMGEKLAHLSYPLKVRREKGGKATLIIKVEGAFGLQLRHLEPQIRARINRVCGAGAFTRLAFQQGLVAKVETERLAQAKAPPVRPPSADLQTALERLRQDVVSAETPSPPRPRLRRDPVSAETPSPPRPRMIREQGATAL